MIKYIGGFRATFSGEVVKRWGRLREMDKFTANC